MKNSSNLPNHSKAKVSLLSEYIVRYLTILSRNQYCNEILIVDCFCGSGRYPDGSEGSALAILKAVKQVQDDLIVHGKEPKTIRCLFNDIDEEKTNILNNILAMEFPDKLDYFTAKVRNIPYQDLIRIILREVAEYKRKKKKLFLFIDPYGYKDISIAAIKALLDTGIVELLLWLPIDQMYRFMQNGSPESLYVFHKELFPNGLPNFNRKSEYIESLRLGFERVLGSTKFVDRFSITNQNNSWFALYFFTSNILGFEKMIEAKWEIDNDLGSGWHFERVLTDDLFRDWTIETRLKQALLKILGTEDGAYNSTIYEHVLRLGYKPKHASDILKSMKKEFQESFEVLNQEGRKSAGFYINYKAYKNEPHKALFRIKRYGKI